MEIRSRARAIKDIVYRDKEQHVIVERTFQDAFVLHAGDPVEHSVPFVVIKPSPNNVWVGIEDAAKRAEVTVSLSHYIVSKIAL